MTKTRFQYLAEDQLQSIGYITFEGSSTGPVIRPNLIGLKDDKSVVVFIRDLSDKDLDLRILSQGLYLECEKYLKKGVTVFYFFLTGKMILAYHANTQQALEELWQTKLRDSKERMAMLPSAEYFHQFISDPQNPVRVGE